MTNTYYAKLIVGNNRFCNYAIVNRYTNRIVSCWKSLSEAVQTAKDLNRRTAPVMLGAV